MFRIHIASYTTNDASDQAAREAMLDIQLVRSQLEASRGGIEAAVARYASGEDTPDLLVVETESDEDGIKQELEALSGVVSPGTQIVVVGRRDSIEFYRELRDLGIGQYVLGPLDTNAFIRAVRDVFGEDKATARGRVIAVTGAKGGIGASTVCHNMAATLARMYSRPVSMVDLDLHFGTVAIDFNHESRAGMKDALSAVANGSVIDETFIERLFVKEGENLWLLASAPSMQDSSALLTPDTVETVIDTVARMSEFVVVDVPHVWSPAFGSLLLSADEVVIVSDPTLAGLRNTQLLFEALGPGKPQNTFLRYVINGTGLADAGEIGTKDFTETVGSAPITTIGWQPVLFRTASEQGRMIGDNKKTAKTVASFDDIARAVSNRRSGPAEGAKAAKKGLLSGLFAKKAKAATKG